MGSPAYLDGLRMLARRELSEAQIRQRLARRGHDSEAIEAAAAQLKAEGALNDERVAGAIARFEAGVRRHGRIRARRTIAHAGIADAIARRAVDDVFADADTDALIEEALMRRIRGRDRIEDDREAGRLYRYLLSQGFEADRVSQIIRKRRRP